MIRYNDEPRTARMLKVDPDEYSFLVMKTLEGVLEMLPDSRLKSNKLLRPTLIDSTD